MASPSDYLRAVHALARGRDHRIDYAAEVDEVQHPVTGTAGAWVPVVVWIAAAEAEHFSEKENTCKDSSDSSSRP